MPKPYPAEFRQRAVALVRAGKPVPAVAPGLGISESCLRNWVRRHRIDHGEIVDATTMENAELKAARKRLRAAGLMPSFGSVGDGLDNAMMESFWSSMPLDLLDRQRWNTRLELAKTAHLIR